MESGPTSPIGPRSSRTRISSYPDEPDHIQNPDGSPRCSSIGDHAAADRRPVLSGLGAPRSGNRSGASKRQHRRGAGPAHLCQGRVLTRSGAPVPHARIDIWQANAAGKYRHPSDINPAPLDPNFKGFARLTTDASGHYSFRTIKPGRYPTAEGDVRPPHIHLTVEGRFDCLVTQLYFAGEGRKSDRPLAQCGPASGTVDRYSAGSAIASGKARVGRAF